MKTALIAGASGLVGSYLVKILAGEPRYSKVIILVRKPLKLDLPKLEQVIFDYNKPDPDKIAADDIYCCLGTTIRKAGSQKAFKEVDYEYPLLIAQAGARNGAKGFALVSAMGAEARSRIFYNRVKGEVEVKLSEIPFERLMIFRPSLLLGPRGDSRFGEEAAKVFMNVFGFLFPKRLKAIHASQVAGCMAASMLESNPGVTILESDKMQSYPIKE